jgi:hypothetical protein
MSLDINFVTVFKRNTDDGSVSHARFTYQFSQYLSYTFTVNCNLCLNWQDVDHGQYVCVAVCRSLTVSLPLAHTTQSHL